MRPCGGAVRPAAERGAPEQELGEVVRVGPLRASSRRAPAPCAAAARRPSGGTRAARRRGATRPRARCGGRTRASSRSGVNARKSCWPTIAAAQAASAASSSGRRMVQLVAGPERVGPLVGEDAVDVGARPWRRRGRRSSSAARSTSSRAMSAGRRRLTARSGRSRGARSETTFAGRVHARVGAPGDRQRARVDRERRGQVDRDRAQAGLHRPAAEVGAVVGDGQPVGRHQRRRAASRGSARGRRARCRPSARRRPCRGPSLTMRV